MKKIDRHKNLGVHVLRKQLPYGLSEICYGSILPSELPPTTLYLENYIKVVYISLAICMKATNKIVSTVIQD